MCRNYFPVSDRTISFLDLTKSSLPHELGLIKCLYGAPAFGGAFWNESFAPANRYFHDTFWGKISPASPYNIHIPCPPFHRAACEHCAVLATYSACFSGTSYNCLQQKCSLTEFLSRVQPVTLVTVGREDFCLSTKTNQYIPQPLTPLLLCFICIQELRLCYCYHIPSKS